DEGGEEADQDGRRRPQGGGGGDERDHTGAQGRRIAGGGQGEQRGHGDSGGGDQPGPGVPGVRAVAGAQGAAAAEPEAREGGGEAGEEHGDAVGAALGGEESVRSRADTEQAAEGEGGSGTADGGRDIGGAAVSARVHRGGEGDRALQRALQDGESYVQETAYALVRAAAQAAGGAEPLDVGDEV